VNVSVPEIAMVIGFPRKGNDNLSYFQ